MSFRIPTAQGTIIEDKKIKTTFNILSYNVGPYIKLMGNGAFPNSSEMYMSVSVLFIMISEHLIYSNLFMIDSKGNCFLGSPTLL